jgi:hypothetical protein
MRRFARFIVPAALALSALVIPRASHAQVVEGITLERLGLLGSQGTGARPFAMGGAYTAVSDDGFALMYNPAGLADVRRKEISVGFHQRRDEITNRYLTLSSTQTSTYTSLGHVAAVYPYPTYRGSLVFAFGVFQSGNSDLESIKNVYLEDIPAEVSNSFVSSGTIYQYRFGVGFDLSPQVAVGATFSLWDESVDFNDEINYADNDSTAFWNDNVSMDLDGVSFSLGLLIRASEHVRAGLSISSPAWLSFDGSGVTTYDGTYASGEGWTTDPDYGVIDEDYTLPMKFTGGAAIEVAALTLAADVGYTDYSQTKHNGLAITSGRDTGMDRVLKETWDFHVGAELALPRVPVRVRGGFAYIPLELSNVEDIAYIANDVPTSAFPRFEAERERKFFTFGIGGLIDRVLTLDLGVSIGAYEKTTSDSGRGTVFTEKRSIVEGIVSGAYRF